MSCQWCKERFIVMKDVASKREFQMWYVGVTERERERERESLWWKKKREICENKRG